MKSESNNPVLVLMKHPSAWIPLLMSLVALAFLLGYVALNGIANGSGDEGTPAHLFQLIMVAQFPVAAYFAFKWLPRQTKPALLVLVLQALAWFIPIAAVIWFESR